MPFLTAHRVGTCATAALWTKHRFDSLFQHPFYLINNTFHNLNVWFWCPDGENCTPPSTRSLYKSCISSGILPKAFDVFCCPCITLLFILWILLSCAFLSLFHTIPQTSTYSFINSVSFTVRLKHSLFEKVLKGFFLVCAFLIFICWTKHFIGFVCLFFSLSLPKSSSGFTKLWGLPWFLWDLWDSCQVMW